MSADTTNPAARWVKRSLRGSEVYARVDERGELVTGTDGRVDVLYKLAPGAKVYRAAAGNLEATPGGDAPVELDLTAPPPAPPPATRPATRPAPRTKADGRSSRHSDTRPIPPDAIIAYTDGGCSPNPGPGAIGVVLRDGDTLVELAEYQGESTNNICELRAVERALECVPPEARKTRTVVVHADSEYAINLLANGWKAKANVELVARIRALVATFGDLRFIKVLAHSGIPDNERADSLVNEARSKARAASRRW